MLADLLSESYDPDLEESWENERTATPSRVAADKTAVKISGELSWLYAAIDIESKLILDVALFGWHGTDPAAAFLQKLHENHDLSEAEFLVDQFGYRTTLLRVGLSGRVNYTDRNLIEKWFHPLKMRINCFHTSWVSSRASVCKCLVEFIHYSNSKDRITLSTEKHQSRRCRTRQCP